MTGGDARVAASVEYTRAAGHDGSPGVRGAESLDIRSLDGRTGPAVLLRPAGAGDDAPLVVSVHGSGASFATEPVRTLSTGLAAAGVPVLAITTRQTGDAVNTDAFFATVRDIEAAFWVARDLGFERIVLHGHSLGSSQVAHFAAAHWHPQIAGVVLTGMFADLPWKTRHVLVDDEEAYARLGAAAREAARAGDFDRVLPEPMRWLGGVEKRVTAQHFLSYRDTGTASARSVEWIARVPYPLLLVRDEHDPVIQYFEPGQLEAAAAAGLPASVRSELLASPPGTDGHAFEGSGPALIELVAGWIADLRKGHHR